MQLVNLEQGAVEALAGLLISAGQDGDGAKINARAQTALAIAKLLSDTEAGNGAQASVDVLALVQTGNIDPGVALALTNYLALGAGLLSAQANILKLLPLLGTANDVLVQNLINGITAAANAEIAKYPAVVAPVVPAAAMNSGQLSTNLAGVAQLPGGAPVA
jgi:hypothetical protein